MPRVKRRGGRLVPASRRAGLSSCPACPAHRSSLWRHFARCHPRFRFLPVGDPGTPVIAWAIYSLEPVKTVRR